MSTPAPVVKTSWLKEHERIVLTFLVLSFGIYGFNHWLDKSATDATTKAAYAEQSAAEAKSVTTQALAQLAQQQAQFNQAEQARQTEMASLVAAIASRDAASATRVKAVEAPKTPTQAVADVQTNYVLPAPITVTADGADVPTADLQLFTATKINGDTCTADLQDTRTQLSSTTAGLTQATGLLTTKDKAIADLEAADVKTAEANAAEVKQLKAEARKSRWHWFVSGFTLGFLGRSAIK
jgi:predicted ribosome quality control (RQC) complex YloA/Tae2 family protein